MSQAVTTARTDVFTSPVEKTKATRSSLGWFKVIAPVAFVIGLGTGAWYLTGSSDQPARAVIDTPMPLVRTNSISDQRDSGEATGNHAARIGESMDSSAAIASAESVETESTASASTPDDSQLDSTDQTSNAIAATTDVGKIELVSGSVDPNTVPQPLGGGKTDSQERIQDFQSPSAVAQGRYTQSQAESSAVQPAEQGVASHSSVPSSDPGSLAEARYQAVIRELEADLQDAMLIAEESNAVAYPINASRNKVTNADRATTDVSFGDSTF